MIIEENGIVVGKVDLKTQEITTDDTALGEMLEQLFDEGVPAKSSVEEEGGLADVEQYIPLDENAIGAFSDFMAEYGYTIRT